MGWVGGWLRRRAGRKAKAVPVTRTHQSRQNGSTFATALYSSLSRKASLLADHLMLSLSSEVVSVPSIGAAATIAAAHPSNTPRK